MDDLKINKKQDNFKAPKAKENSTTKIIKTGLVAKKPEKQNEFENRQIE